MAPSPPAHHPAPTANDTAVVPAADGNPTNLRHCTIDGCDGRFYARGMCNRHYQRWKRGDPLEPEPRRGRRLPASFKVFRG